MGGSESLNSSTLVISKQPDTKSICSGDYRKSPVNRGFDGIQYLFVSDLECRSKTLLSIVRMFSLSPITCGSEPSVCVAAGSWARRKQLGKVERSTENLNGCWHHLLVTPLFREH